MANRTSAKWWWLIPLLLVVFWLGAHSLNTSLIWIDELDSIVNIGGADLKHFAPYQILDTMIAGAPQHVPGYFFALSVWSTFTGWTPFGLRAFSLLIGLLAVAWTYRAGADWLSKRAGWYAALVLSANAFFIYYTREMRMYTLYPWLTVVVLWQYRRMIDPHRQPGRWAWVVLFVSMVALLYTHPVAMAIPAALGLYHLLFVPKNRRWWALTATMALASATLLLWLWVLLMGSKNVGEVIALNIPDIVGLMMYLFSNGNVPLLLILLALAVVRIRQRGARDVWFFTLSILALTLAIHLKRPILSATRMRYLIDLWPLLALLVGLGLTVAERYRIVALGLLALWLGFGVGNTLNPDFLIWQDGPRYVKDYPPLREILRETNRRAEPDDLLITFSRHYHVFGFVKYQSIGGFYMRDLISDGYYITLPDEQTPDDRRQDMETALGTRLTVWLAYEPIIAPETLQLYRDILAERYLACGTVYDQPDLRIDRYHLAAFGCLAQQPTSTLIAYNEGIRLNDLQVDNTSGDQLLVAASWSVDDQVPANTYSESFKLWQDSDTFVAQSDFGLRSAGFGWKLVTLPVADLPPGDYTLTVTVYNWSTGERLVGTPTEGAQGEELPVAHVHLGPQE